MAYKGWQIAKWKRERAEKALPYKQMKDRDMRNVEVVFKKSPLLQGKYYYYFEEIHQSGEKITMTYIANLGGMKGCSKYWTWHGYGGWIPFITFDEIQFNKMKTEVKRLGGIIILK